MRSGPGPMLLRATALAAPLFAAAPLHAQAYCAQFSDGTSPDCGFATLQMCMASVTGLGGVCLNNPNAQAASTQAPPPPLPLPPGQTQYQLFPSQPLPQQQAAAPAAAPPQGCNPVVDGTYCASNGGSMAVAAGGMPRIQSISSDLGIGGDNAATLGGINISGGSTCLGLFRRMACGG
jgi:Protein of unknown function (DUF3551)